MKKNTLITGANGFLGRQIARKFADCGWQVIGLGHGSWDKKQWNQYGISCFFNCDITFENLERFITTPLNLVIHCAGTGSVGASYSNPREDFRKNVSSSYDLLEYIRIHTPSSHLIFPSSASVYGLVENIPITEDSILKPISPYGLHKKNVEDLCTFFSYKYNLNIDIIRFFSIYGPGLKKQLIWDACKKIYQGDYEFFGNGEEVRDFIHIDDSIRLIWLLSCKQSTGLSIVNGGNGIGITIREVVNQIQKGFGDLNQISFNNQVREGDPPYMIADTSKIRELGWTPTVPLDIGIKNYISWFISENKKTE